jgi:hypothetical protein
MAVLWAIADEQQHRQRRQALDEAVEEGLRLTVDPLEIHEYKSTPGRFWS